MRNATHNTAEDRALARLVADGHLRLGNQRATYQPSPIKPQAGLAQQLLDEDRGP